MIATGPRVDSGRRPESRRPPDGADVGALPVPRSGRLLSEEVLPRSAPHAPTGVSAEAEDGFAYVTWDPPCLDGGLPVTSYTVTSSGGARMTVSAPDFPLKGYVVFGNLENGAGVAFTVAATNEAGTSPPSLGSAAVVPLHRRRLKAPQPPTSVSLTVGVGGSKLQLTPPTATGGSPGNRLIRSPRFLRVGASFWRAVISSIATLRTLS